MTIGCRKLSYVTNPHTLLTNRQNRVTLCPMGVSVICDGAEEELVVTPRGREGVERPHSQAGPIFWRDPLGRGECEMWIDNPKRAPKFSDPFYELRVILARNCA